MNFVNKLAGKAGRIVRRLASQPEFSTSDVVIGRNTSFGRNVRFKSRKVRIGDGVRIGDNVLVAAEDFSIGDYGTIYGDCFFPGPGRIQIGHNFWAGKGAIVDAMGGTTIGNNVCIGVQTQLWTHMVFGDTLAGCRFHKVSEVWIGDDVWFGGNCLVSPIRCESRSLAMLGSVVVHDMAFNRVYAGVPARDITDKVGPPFIDADPNDMAVELERRILAFKEKHPQFAGAKIGITTTNSNDQRNYDLIFNVQARTYTKRNTKLEYALIRHLLPEAKFTPMQTD